MESKFPPFVPTSRFRFYSDYFYLRLVNRIKTEKLHEHQIHALLATREFFAGTAATDTRIAATAIIVLPTGCGKSGIAVLAPYVLGASRVLVVTPSLTITEQLGRDFIHPQECFIGKTLCDSSDNFQDALPPAAVIRDPVQVESGLSCEVMITNAHKIGGRSSVEITSIPENHYDLVIVDEAHHYPAETWRLLVDHFAKSKRIFLTATNLHGGQPILPEVQPCYKMTYREGVNRGIIRNIDFDEVEGTDTADEIVFHLISERIKFYLDHHDSQARDNMQYDVHQAMVLTQTIESAVTFRDVYNRAFPNGCRCYTSRDTVHYGAFNNHEFRTLVVVGKLLEGYDNKNVSVVAIVRNVRSKVLFTQFIGRAVRKLNPDDPVHAVLVSHQRYSQRVNFKNFDEVAEEENEEENEEN